jgi:hypothetical protein
MRYILPCFLPEPIRAYHAALVDEIATRFDLPYTRRQAIPQALFATLRTLPWMPWSPHDGEALRPHMTIAEGCRPRFTEVWRHVLARGRQFDAALDNLTVLRQVGKEDGITRWAVHRAFRLSVTAAGGRAPGTPATS